MWESFKIISHGRISLRRLPLLATSFLMAIFLATGVITPTVLAADAVRSGNTVTYEGKTYQPIDKTATPSQVPAGLPTTEGYVSFDTSGKKAYYLLTNGPAASSTTATYTVYDMPTMGSYGNHSPPTNIAIVSSPVSAATQQNSGTTCDSTQTAGIGWILCPVVNFLAKSMDYIYKVIADFLVVRTITTDTSGSLYRMWAIIRDIANLCFVGVFLVIIYSQISGLGYSNYNLKKMLPRLIIGAILVNTSFWISALAVDASNILGVSIHDVFMTVMQNLNTNGNYDSVTVPDWQSITIIALSGSAATAGLTIFVLANTVTGALALLIPALVGVLLAALVAFVVLAARQALIVCLVIISPLAFAAMLLPNTEKYFDKWRGALTTLLLLFPIFSVIFSGAQLAGMAIVQSAGGNLVTIILGMTVQVAPIVITPLLVKFSGGLIGRIAGMVNNPNKGLLDRTKNWSKGFAAERRNRAIAGRMMPDGTTQLKRRHVPTAYLDARRRAREGRRKAYEAGAEARFSGTRQGHDVEALNKHYGNVKARNENRFAASPRGNRLEIEARHIAVDKQNIESVMMNQEDGRKLRTRQIDADTLKKTTENNYARTREGQGAEHRSRLADVDKQNVENDFESSSFGHDVDRAKRVAERTKARIHAEHQADWDDSVRNNVKNLLEDELRLKRAEARANSAKAMLEKAHTEIVAQGDSSEHILNLRTTSGSTKSGMLTIARDIKDATLDASFAADAKAQAERKIAEIKADTLDKNTHQIEGQSVVTYSAGIMKEVGERSVVARVKTERSKFMLDDIKNIENTADFDITSSPAKLYKLFESAQTDEERVAYTSIMAKRGAPGASRLRDMIREMESRVQSGRMSHADMSGYKELVIAQNPNILGLGKDLEFFFTNASYDGDHPDPSLAGKIKSFDEITNDVGTWGNLSADAFSRMNYVNQMQGLRILAHKKPEKYDSLVRNLKRSPGAMANLKDEVIAAIGLPPSHDSWRTGVFNTPSKDELTPFEEEVLEGRRATTFDLREDYPDINTTEWEEKYNELYEKTEALLRDAKARGVDYETAPDHKPTR